MSNRYSPLPAPSGQEYTYRELLTVSRAIEEARESVPLEILSVAPTKPLDGMTVYADGTHWDPGSGEGIYTYIGGAWTPLFLGGAGGGQSSIQFKDEGTNLGTTGTVTSVDFVGSGVTATRVSNALTVTISSGGLSDGDKGDITVGGGGTTLTIDGQAVSYSKIQNISATDKVLGRSSAGAGVIEEITCTAAGRALLDDATAADQRTTLAAEGTANKDAANGYAGLNASSRTTKGVDTTDDVVIDLATKGLVLKDTQGTPHYWRVTISTAGALVTTDLGTGKP